MIKNVFLHSRIMVKSAEVKNRIARISADISLVSGPK